MSNKNNNKPSSIDLINDTNATIPELSQFEQWLQLTLQAVPDHNNQRPNRIVIRIVSSAESAQLNTTFRHKTGPTNILAFVDEAIPGFPANDLGSLAICGELVCAEAKAQHKPIIAHWAHLTIHGILHLLGFDHQNTAEAAVMESLEIKLLAQLGYANPY